MGNKGAIDRAIAQLAAAQYGVVSTSQLAEIGLGRSGASRRARAGGLHRVHRGVYAVGHQRLSYKGRWWAALLTCGEGAVLSHRSAAMLWGFLPPREGPVDITVPRRSGRRDQAGIKVHRSDLLAGATTRRHGIPVTAPARTIADLRGLLQASRWRDAVRQAAVLGFDVDSVEPERTRSELELGFLRLCRRHRLPRPETGARIDVFIVDFLWREPRLVVELDGFRYHRGRGAFESDRARDARLTALGYRVLRFTYRQLNRDRRKVVATLWALLGPQAATLTRESTE